MRRQYARPRGWTGPWASVASLVWLVFSAAIVWTPCSAQPRAPMHFERVQALFCPPEGCILATGSILPDTHQAFSRALRALDVEPGAEVLLDSPGGDVVGALKFGLKIRKAGLRTHVVDRSGVIPTSGACASACAYAFLGGVSRRVDPEARLGVHQFAGGSDGGGFIGAAETQRFVALIAEYLASVGANLRVQTIALRTPADQIHWLSRSELNVLSVVTPEPAVLQTRLAAAD